MSAENPKPRRSCPECQQFLLSVWTQFGGISGPREGASSMAWRQEPMPGLAAVCKVCCAMPQLADRRLRSAQRTQLASKAHSRRWVGVQSWRADEDWSLDQEISTSPMPYSVAGLESG